MNRPGLTAFQDRLVDIADARGSHRTVRILDVRAKPCRVGRQRNHEGTEFVGCRGIGRTRRSCCLGGGGSRGRNVAFISIATLLDCHRGPAQSQGLKGS